MWSDHVLHSLFCKNMIHHVSTFYMLLLWYQFCWWLTWYTIKQQRQICASQSSDNNQHFTCGWTARRAFGETLDSQTLATLLASPGCATLWIDALLDAVPVWFADAKFVEQVTCGVRERSEVITVQLQLKKNCSQCCHLICTGCKLPWILKGTITLVLFTSPPQSTPMDKQW